MKDFFIIWISDTHVSLPHPDHCGISLKPKPAFSLFFCNYTPLRIVTATLDLPKSMWMPGHVHLVICGCLSPSLCVAILVWLSQLYKPPGLVISLYGPFLNASNSPASVKIYENVFFFSFLFFILANCRRAHDLTVSCCSYKPLFKKWKITGPEVRQH